MARLSKTRIEWEGNVREKLTVIEGETPPVWSKDTLLNRVGNPQPRVDAREKVTGKAVYTFDIQLPGMLFAQVLRSPYPHAKIEKIDVSGAVSLPGVREIITCREVPGLAWHGVEIFAKVLRHEGAEIAALAADDPDIAEDALERIKVDYTVLPFVIDPESALGPDAPGVYPQGNLVPGFPRNYSRGSIEQGLSQADIILEKHYSTQSVPHNCLESHGAVASWNGDELTVWESTQSIHRVQEDLAEIFNLPLNRVRVICEFMGGGFGSKQYTGKWSVIAALLARRTGRPVHLMLDRHADDLAAGNRAPTVQHLKIGARNDGTLTAIELKALIGIGAYGFGAPNVEGPVQVMYACPNVSTSVNTAFTNTGPARSFRGPGYVEGTFPLEALLDELAERLDIDPVEIRLKNYAAKDQVSGRPYSAKNLKECYERAAAAINWDSQVKENGSKTRAMGMASQIWGGGGGPPAFAWVKLNKDGSVEVMTASQDIGTGTRTIFAQIAAEVLDLEPERVVVRIGDTLAGPYAPVSWGSMTVPSVGPAVRQAAMDVLEQLREIAAGILDAPPGDIRIQQGKVYLRGDREAKLGLEDIFEKTGNFTILGKGSREANSPDFEVRTFGAQFAEVEVDNSSGEIEVKRVVTAQDFGRVMNPLSAGNQVEGAVVQGTGFALLEGRIIDSNTGVTLNANMEDSRLPTSRDFGEIEHLFVDLPDEKANNLGAKGLGEPAMVPTAPAIVNAVARATGVRFYELPLRRDKVLQALESKRLKQERGTR